MEPIFFERNRVFRVYLGGKLFSDFFGDAPEDSNYPEEWVASRVKALNKNSKDPHEGLSKPIGYDMYFDELLNKYPEKMLGEKGSFEVLVKLLDSAIRLPAQAHPDRAFSEKYFNSTHGKAESWIILATRPGAKIYFGFKEGVTEEMFIEASEKSIDDETAMQELMNPIDVKPGDVFFIPAKTVHAIGAGCLLLEAQEPTDFTLQPERKCGDYVMSEEEMYLGLDRKTALECFDFNSKKEARVLPEIIEKTEAFTYETLIGPKSTELFKVNRITVKNGAFKLNAAPAVYVVTKGSGTLLGDGYKKEIKKGDYFFLPFCEKGNYRVEAKDIEIIECR